MKSTVSVCYVWKSTQFKVTIDIELVYNLHFSFVFFHIYGGGGGQNFVRVDGGGWQ